MLISDIFVIHIWPSLPNLLLVHWRILNHPLVAHVRAGERIIQCSSALRLNSSLRAQGRGRRDQACSRLSIRKLVEALKLINADVSPPLVYLTISSKFSYPSFHRNYNPPKLEDMTWQNHSSLHYENSYWQKHKNVIGNKPSYVSYPPGSINLADRLEGSYKNGLIGKLSMKVSDYYKSALAAANSTDFPSAGFFPPVSLSLLFFPLPEKWTGWANGRIGSHI